MKTWEYLFEGEGVRCDNVLQLYHSYNITHITINKIYNKIIVSNQNDEGKCEITNKIQKTRNKMFNENHKNVLII